MATTRERSGHRSQSDWQLSHSHETKRRSTGHGAKKPFDPQRPERKRVPDDTFSHELSHPKRVPWLPAYGMMSATSIPVSCDGVKTHICMDDSIAFSGRRVTSYGGGRSTLDFSLLHGTQS